MKNASLYQAWLILPFMLLLSCSPSEKIGRSAREMVINQKALKSAHVGICIYDPSTGKYLYNYQGDKYFVPASNTKIATCYAAMKFLGDSLVGLYVSETPNHIFLISSGDPTFLYPDFKTHPVFDFLKSLDTSRKFLWFNLSEWNDLPPFGSGWSWNDYESSDMAERSVFPIYGNLARFSGNYKEVEVKPAYFMTAIQKYSVPAGRLSMVKRDLYANNFKTYSYGSSEATISIPFRTSDTLASRLLIDTLHLKKRIAPPNSAPPGFNERESVRLYCVYSHPTDSLLKPMMHESNNFFAEQTLLMVSRTVKKTFNEQKAIDTLLQTDFRDLPQRPRWVDGSGLSRYNLFTPQDMVVILNKMKDTFGMERIKTILATGNQGTLEGRYKEDSSFIYAKTGTLSGVIALSGYLYTKKGKLLIFSVLVNNHQVSATSVRNSIEAFITDIRAKY
jgi:D-alanyl-D-alanine carboxypeptidase/D-alanyl-D-alanine-endopeptidase (penicillin-binding protein 4)